MASHYHFIVLLILKNKFYKKMLKTICLYGFSAPYPGRGGSSKGRGAHLNKLSRAEGGAKILGVFRVKNPLDPPLYGVDLKKVVDPSLKYL
jgi:hypothetical protein